MSLDTPVALLIFNRPELTRKVFEAIAQAKPKKLLVVADGPRDSAEYEKCACARSVLDGVNWDCDVLTNFSDVNLGCRSRVSSGLDWVFSQFEEAIILEDDCVPNQSFFKFCQDLLRFYRNDCRVMHISGDNFQFGKRSTHYSYYFSKYTHIWGWATWRRAWKYYDVSMKTWPEAKYYGLLQTVHCDREEQQYWSDLFDRVFKGEIDTWDYQWNYACWLQNGLSVLPASNLVSNIGFGPEATHTKSFSSISDLPAKEMQHITHPASVFCCRDSDRKTFCVVFKGLPQTVAESAGNGKIEPSLGETQPKPIELPDDKTDLYSELSEEINGYSELNDEQAEVLEQMNQHEQDSQKLAEKLPVVRSRLRRQRDRTKNLESRVESLQQSLSDAHATIRAMESSKFWRLRGQWFRLKRLLGIPDDEQISFQTADVNEDQYQLSLSENLPQREQESQSSSSNSETELLNEKYFSGSSINLEKTQTSDLATSETQNEQESSEETLFQVLKNVPRYTPVRTNFLGAEIELVDAASFLSMYDEIFEKQIYNFHASAPRPFIIDGGANVGLSLVYFKQIYPDCRIIAFEPDVSVFHVLQKNIRAFNFSSIELVNKALWSSETVLEFMAEGADAGRMVEIDREAKISKVQTVRLRKYLLTQPVDLLKLDIEGAETEVLEDCCDCLDNVSNVFVEYHSFADRPQTLNIVSDILIKAGFRIHIQPINISPQPFCSRNVYLGMDLQLNIFAFRD